MTTDDLPAHLERFLGTIQAGWTTDEAGRQTPFQIVQFTGPIYGGVPLATLGLSRHVLTAEYSGKSFREEVIMLVPESVVPQAPGIMHQVVGENLDSGKAFVRGGVIGPRGKLFPGTAMEALYTAAPVYLPDEFATYHGADYNVIIPWLIPITHAEAHYVFDHGWREFEARMMELQPDLVDLERPSMV